LSPFATRMENPCMARDIAAVLGASMTRCTWFPWTEAKRGAFRAPRELR